MAIIFALQAEVDALRRLLINERSETCHTLPLIYGKINNKAMALIGCGSAVRRGGEYLTEYLAMVMRQVAPHIIINIGIAGALNKEIYHNTLFIPSEYLHYNTHSKPSAEVVARTNPTLFTQIIQCCIETDSQIVYHTGKLLTVPYPVQSPYERARLYAHYTTPAVDMEASVLASLAADNQIPFGCVKWISDTPRQSSPATIAQHLSVGGEVLASVVCHISRLGY